MKRIGISQRVDNIQRYSERRDCLDQRWSRFAWQLGYMPMPLPNISPHQVAELLDAFDLDVILLSGGNSITHLDTTAEDSAPERDDFEIALLKEAIKRDIPVLGVCRGMQIINVYLAGTLCSVEGHVGVQHSLLITKDGYPISEKVNSYHNWAIPREGLAKQLRPLAFDSEGHVEAFEHNNKRLFGIMWHPEREQPFNPLDIELIKRFIS